jgi:hypothetical protein
MGELAMSRREIDGVAILFSPTSLPVADIFRVLGDFEENHDVAALDSLESRLSGIMSRETAKGIVSDSLLLAFGLRRERPEPLDLRPLLSRHGSLDEYCIVALVGATFWHDFGLAGQAAAALGVRQPQPLVSLGFEIARQFEAAGVTLEIPDARLFRSYLPDATVELVAAAAGRVDLRFSFDF